MTRWLLAALLLLASCGNDNGSDLAHFAAPPDRIDCELGQHLTPKGQDGCRYPGRSEILTVPAPGRACLDNDCEEAHTRHWQARSTGQPDLTLQVEQVGDGFIITQLGDQTTTPTAPPTPGAPGCHTGMTLGVGESCQHGSMILTVQDDGSACVGTICAGTGMTLGGFVASRTGDSWTVEQLPG